MMVHNLPDNSPNPRSGHKAVATNTDLYIWGGYCPRSDSNVSLRHTQSNNPLVFLEMWRFNLVTNKWDLCPHTGNFPKVGAASSTMCLDDANKTIYVYGGTNYPFGESVSNSLFACDLANHEWRCLKLVGDTLPKSYGSSIAYLNGKLYIMFGTDGFSFHSHVYEIELKSNTCKLVNQTLQEKDITDSGNGRYRQEIVVWRNKIYVFGGGGYESVCYGMKNIPVFDVIRRKWSWKNAALDFQYGFPTPRRHHTVVLCKGGAYLFGGVYQATAEDREEPVETNVWRYDLKANSWRRLDLRTPSKMFFHAAAVNSCGLMFVHGGIVQPDPQRSLMRRTFSLCSTWLSVPRLFDYLVYLISERNSNHRRKSPWMVLPEPCPGPAIPLAKIDLRDRILKPPINIEIRLKPSSVELMGIDNVRELFKPPRAKRVAA